MIECDFQERYGIDLGADGLLSNRSARWLKIRIRGLFDPGVDSRVQTAVRG